MCTVEHFQITLQVIIMWTLPLSGFITRTRQCQGYCSSWTVLSVWIRHHSTSLDLVVFCLCKSLGSHMYADTNVISRCCVPKQITQQIGYDCVLYATAWKVENCSLGYRNGQTQPSQREVGIDTREGGREGREGREGEEGREGGERKGGREGRRGEGRRGEGWREEGEREGGRQGGREAGRPAALRSPLFSHIVHSKNNSILVPVIMVTSFEVTTSTSEVLLLLLQKVPLSSHDMSCLHTVRWLLLIQ